MRALAVISATALAASLALTPASARLWKASPEQMALDYLSLNHNKGAEGRVIVSWLAPVVVPQPAAKQILEKYVLVSIARTRTGPGGLLVWDDVQGVQLTDGNGQPLKEMTGDAIPPALVGLIASSDATMHQNTQSKSKVYWGVWEAGAVNACQKGKLVVIYDSENYSFDTPVPGCP